MFGSRYWGDAYFGPRYWGNGAVALVTVPDVVGETQAAGTATLEGDGFVVAVETAYSSTVPAGSIISQVPAGGVEAAPGSTVTITVSLGDQPEQEGGGGPDPKKRQEEFWYWLEKAREQIRQSKDRQERIEAESRQIPEKQDREIARLIKEQEQGEIRQAELSELRAYVESSPVVPDGGMAEIIRKAAIRATDDDLMRLRRQMARLADEEAQAVVMALLMLQ